MAAVDAGADAIGLNFYLRSPRYVRGPVAEEISSLLPLAIKKVGLFVNESAEVMLNCFDKLHLDLLQLHGDESPALIAELGDRPVMKAFRVAGEEGWKAINEFLCECDRLDCMPRMILLDAVAGGSFGGTGKIADWSLAKRYQAANLEPTLVLAGGLTPMNVAEAIAATGVSAVDTASGVESAPGIKNQALMAAFVKRARRAFG